ncbi:hypothetical protein [Pseudoxanthomonas beigongshangi]
MDIQRSSRYLGVGSSACGGAAAFKKPGAPPALARKSGNVPKLLYAFCFLAVLGSGKCLAQETTAVPGSERLTVENFSRLDPVGNINQSDPFGESIDLQAGTLSFQQVDLTLEGNGPAIRIARSWSVARNAHHYNFAGHTGVIQDWELEFPAIESSLLLTSQPGSLWKASGPDPSKRCSNFGYPNHADAQFWWKGAYLNLPGESREMLLRRDPAYTLAPGGQTANYPIVTKGNWAISCTSATKNNDGGEGFVALSPSGSKYWFDWYTQEYFGDITSYYGTPIRLPPTQAPWDMPSNGVYEVRLRPSRIEDAQGNYVEYLYTGNNLTRIQASDGRFVNLAYEVVGAGGTNPYSRLIYAEYANGDGGMRRINYAYHQVTYEYPTRINRGLRSVTYADGTSWTMDLLAANGVCRYKSALPSGAYDFQCYPTGVYQGISGLQASITSPSGLIGTYSIGHGAVERWAENCTEYGYAGTGCYLYPVEPTLSPAFRLQWKTYSGIGVPASTWTYTYKRSPQTPLTIISNPDGSKDVYAYGAYNKYSRTEGELLSVQEGAVLSGDVVVSAKRTTTYEYSTGPKLGTAPQFFVNRLQSEHVGDASKTTVMLDGTTYVSQVMIRDSLYRPTSIKKFNALHSKTDGVELHDDTGRWILGQVARALTNGIEVKRVSFDSEARPWKIYSFGKLQQTLTYDTSAVSTGQRGTLRTVTDGNGNTSTFTAWKHGIPQLVGQANGTSREALVDDAGQIRWVENEVDARTCFQYDAAGRVTKVTYPSETALHVCDTSRWRAVDSALFQSTEAYGGLPAGHWRKTVVSGAGTRVSYLDAFWRPIIEEDFDVSSKGDTLSQTVIRFDEEGRTVFQSYPQRVTDAGVLNTWGDPTMPVHASVKGVHTEYDALGRVTSVSRESELAAPANVLTTLTEYLDGLRLRVTSPKLTTTTTSYLAYDEQMLDWPLTVTQPEGLITTITRDVFGKPLSITRSSASGLESVTRSYTYNAYQELCKSEEPETGGTLHSYDAAGNLIRQDMGFPLGVASCAAPQMSTMSGPPTGGDLPPQMAPSIIRTYDTLNRLDSVQFTGGIGNVVLAYTPDGLLASISSDNGNNDIVTTTYTYNQRRLNSSERMQWGGIDWSIGYGYDDLGHVAAKTVPGLTITYLPNALGQATQAGAFATQAKYHPNGLLKQFIYGNGIVHATTLNARQLPARSYDVGGGTAMDLAYSYDGHSNLSGILDATAGARQSRTMSYDGMDRLLTAQSQMYGGTDNTARYTYDALDNLRSLSVDGRNYVYLYESQSNRLTSITDGTSTIVGLGYDARGNLRNKNGATLQFDNGNRLRSVVAPGGTSTSSYVYDGHGRRVRDLTSAARYSLYDREGQLVYENDLRNAETIQYVYLNDRMVAQVTNSTAPGTPVLSAPANSTGSYTVSWTTASGATRYELEEVATTPPSTVIHQEQGTSKAINRSVGSYRYRVRACLNGGCSAWSQPASVVVQTSVNGVPTIVVPAVGANGNYTVAWTPVTGATRYELEESATSNVWGAAYQGPALSKAYAGKAAGTYAYRVRACDEAGCSSLSVPGSVVVKYPPGSAPTVSVPATNFTGSYTVSWTAVTGASTFQVSESTNAGIWNLIHDGSGNSRALSGRASGTYLYRARACNEAGCGPQSVNTSMVVTLPPTGAPSVNAPASNVGGNYTVSWSAVTGASSYQLERRLNGAGWVSAYNGSGTSLLISSAPQGTHEYRARACNAGGCGAYSAIAATSVVLIPAAPGGFTGTSEADTDVRPPLITWFLYWNAVAGATSYDVQSQHGTGTPAIVYSGAGTSMGMTGRGSRQFWVRACNSAGCSAWVGPIQP